MMSFFLIRSHHCNLEMCISPNLKRTRATLVGCFVHYLVILELVHGSVLSLITKCSWSHVHVCPSICLSACDIATMDLKVSTHIHLENEVKGQGHEVKVKAHKVKVRMSNFWGVINVSYGEEEVLQCWGPWAC